MTHEIRLSCHKKGAHSMHASRAIKYWYLGPPSVSNFSPQICFWWLRVKGHKFHTLGGFRYKRRLKDFQPNIVLFRLVARNCFRCCCSFCLLCCHCMPLLGLCCCSSCSAVAGVDAAVGGADVAAICLFFYSSVLWFLCLFVRWFARLFVCFLAHFLVCLFLWFFVIVCFSASSFC